MDNNPVPSKTTNIIESRILAMARSDAGIYGQRLLVHLVKKTQQYIRGENFDKVTNKECIEVGLWGDAVFQFHISDILRGEDDKNYTIAKKAINALLDSKLVFEDDNVYEATHILGRATIRKNTGVVEVLVMNTVWQAMLDFSRGYYYYNPDVAIRLTSEYALILYKQLPGQTKPLSYSFDKLRELFNITDKYKRNSDIIDKVLKVAKDELDAVSPFSFSYEKYYSSKNNESSKRGRKACLGVTITPCKILQNQTTADVVKQVDSSLLLDKELREKLQKFGFDYGGIKANQRVFEMAVKTMGNDKYMNWLNEIAYKALHANNPQGYVVNATRNMLQKKPATISNPQKPSVKTSAPPMQGEQSLRNVKRLKAILENTFNEFK